MRVKSECAYRRCCTPPGFVPSIRMGRHAQAQRATRGEPHAIGPSAKATCRTRQRTTGAGEGDTEGSTYRGCMARGMVLAAWETFFSTCTAPTKTWKWELGRPVNPCPFAVLWVVCPVYRACVVVLVACWVCLAFCARGLVPDHPTEGPPLPSLPPQPDRHTDGDRDGGHDSEGKREKEEHERGRERGPMGARPTVPFVGGPVGMGRNGARRGDRTPPTTWQAPCKAPNSTICEEFRRSPLSRPASSPPRPPSLAAHCAPPHPTAARGGCACPHSSSLCVRCAR
jgi:hypothetical protein